MYNLCIESWTRRTKSLQTAPAYKDDEGQSFDINDTSM